MNVRFGSKGNNEEIFRRANKELTAQPQLYLIPRVVSPGRIIGCIVRTTQYRILLRVRRRERRKAKLISVSDILSVILLLRHSHTMSELNKKYNFTILNKLGYLSTEFV